MKKNDILEVWERYKKTGDRKDRDIIVNQYCYLVKYIAGRMSISLPDHIEFDDLLSAGSMGLLKAIEHYDPSRKVPFEFFASQRIKGEMLDDLRRMDWIPRSVRKKNRDLESAIMKLQNKYGRVPRDEELADFLGISTDDLNKLYNDAKGATLVSLQDLVYSENSQHELIDTVKNKNSVEPDELLVKKEIYEDISNFISTLDEKQKLVIALYYYEGLTLKEIGQVLDISESRVSQIHTKSILSLKVKLNFVEKKEKIPT